MFKLQLHPDHHLHSSKRYQTLESTEGSPQLPLGYLTLALLLWIPPLWRAVMDPVLHRYKRKWTEDDLKLS
ncbi:Alkane 1-monooxygenase 2 [Gracilariopsis chorda]|uniref:Alkane 1-monooxygenase 2 n=1 Tax=Gracilariopsis chorda TaxID=448386 RepID=A0A2V3J674_9FLOR|nr:Alkane 1-monooxygenase 2 [Gracilariopsis chorda]|eukprot:PXF49926.1 Alkane 1-monooxygenase 2 [Gracilariopsis chorda]